MTPCTHCQLVNANPAAAVPATYTNRPAPDVVVISSSARPMDLCTACMRRMFGVRLPSSRTLAMLGWRRIGRRSAR